MLPVQVATNEVGDRKTDRLIQMWQNSELIPMFEWDGANEKLTVAYTNYSDGEWHGLFWPGGATQVRNTTNCMDK